MMEFVTRAEGPFIVREFDYENLYFKTAYAFIHVQIIPGVAYLHLYMKRFGGRVLRELRSDLECLKALMKHKGITRLCGTHEVEGAEKWCKFLRLIGFGFVMDTVTPEGKPCKLTLMEI